MSAPTMHLRVLDRVIAVEFGARDQFFAEMHRLWGHMQVAPTEECAETVPMNWDTDRNLGESLSLATHEITYAAIRAGKGRLVLLHAGAVANPETGATLVCVARGGTGKTTLTRRLGQRFGYLSDETVAITQNGRVLPYPKPLSIREPGQDVKRETPPGDLGLVPAPEECWLQSILYLDRDSRHEGVTFTELDLLTALGVITAETSSLGSLPAGLRAIADLVAATRPIRLCEYSESADLTEVLAGELGGAT